MVKEGRPENKKYDSDFDLLPTKHPKRDNFEINVAALPNFINEASTGGRKRNFASELAEMGGSPFFPPFEVVEQIDNLAEIITTELVRINEC